MEAAILAKENKLQEAGAILEQGIQANPKAPNLYVARAGLADNQKQFEVGESFLLKVIELEPKNTGLYNQLVRHYIAARQQDKAEADSSARASAWIRTARNRSSCWLAFWSVKGGVRTRRKTSRILLRGIRTIIRPASAWQNFTWPCNGKGRPGKSWRKSSNWTPTDLRGYKLKTNWLVCNCPKTISTRAEKLANEVLKKHPKDMTATETRGIIALQKKDGLTAVNSFRLLTQDRPQDPQAWLLLARANLLNKEGGQAKDNAKKALELKPDFMDARKFLYGLFLDDKDYDGAIATIQGYLRLNGKDIVNLVSLGEVYALKGDYAQARATFQKIIDLEPKNPQGYFQMARLGLKTKKMDETLKYADKALQENPDFQPALQLVVGIYQEQKQPEKALAAVRQTLARSPKNPQLHQMLGELLMIQRSSPRPPSPRWKKP